jgi:opacity protein-like surface antigen
MTRFSFAKFTLLGLIAAACAGTPANADDWSYGGLKGMRGTAVPVPAPVPVPIYEPKWYLRGDIGFILRSAPGASESGARVGDIGPPDATFGYGDPTGFFSSSWSDDYNTALTFSFGGGYYWSKNFRTDLTFGYHSEGKSTYNGEYRYTDLGATTYEGKVADRTIQRTGTILFNAYYDFADYGRFRPYIGAGLGIAINELERRNSSEQVACGAAAPVGSCSGTLFASPTTTNATNTAVSLAAAVTAGVTYSLGEYTSLDLSYRYLYTGGTHIGMTVGGNNSDVDIDDQQQHQFRAGLRWDIN